jgi:hypothetical protein
VDPNAALKMLREAIVAYRAAVEGGSGDEEHDCANLVAGQAEALDQWLSRGRSLPDAWGTRITNAEVDRLPKRFPGATLHEVRLFVDEDTGRPLYAVIKGEKGWFGAPGLKKGQFLTNSDVRDAIRLVPEHEVHESYARGAVETAQAIAENQVEGP